MADQTIPTPYPNATNTTDGAIPASRQPAFSQETHPTTGAHDPVPEVRHAENHDNESQNRAITER